MCGIAGILGRGSAGVALRDAIAAMCATIRHRGPDDEGFYLDGAFGMGMRRLSIIDLSTGKQPVGNEDGSVWTVFNGEIYNYLELRAELESRGHRFATRSDTEVIVHLYEDFGEDFAKHLAGMFAIALWDRPRQKLVLARDRLGIKPLYYHSGPSRLVFGSEIKALLSAGVDRDVDLQALHDYLSLNYVPGPRSIFTAIRKLPPAHLLVCDDRGERLVRYWEIPYPEEPRVRSEEEACEELFELLKKTVSQHLLADVPLGVFLSGGVDSSSLVALMREVSPQQVRTFSIGFEERSYDELSEAGRIAREFATEHHELVVRPDAARLLPQLVRYFDEPFADSSAIPVYEVSRLARAHVKVALSGEGGDEVFAGYETYAALKWADAYKRLPRGLTEGVVAPLVERLPVSHARVSFDYKARRFVAGALLPPDEGHYWWKVIFSEDAKAALYAGARNGFEDPLRFFREAYASCPARETLTRLQHIDTMVYLPDDLLVKADRMSMANSLEVRVPFLDHRVVEFAAALPARMKLRGLTKKYILRRTMARRLPARVVRGKKRGFNVPMPVWLGGELRELVHDVLGERSLREAGFFDAAAVAGIIRDHENRRADYSRNLYGLLLFMLWRAEYRSGR